MILHNWTKVIDMKVKSITQFLAAVLLAVVVGVQVSLADDLLKADYPDRYTVVDGDTLWDISGKFLNQAWRWPEIWKANESIENPHLIYPGDVLVLTFIDGKPQLRALRRETVKLGPKVREENLQNAIPPTSPDAIAPYLSAPLVTTADEINKSAYVVEGLDNKLVAGKYDQVYVRGMSEEIAEQYRIFRPGRTFVNPETGENLGLEAIHVGDARVLKPGETARISILDSFEEVAVLDRLRPVDVNKSVPYFYPRAHDDLAIKGYILEKPNRATELGALDIAVITLGERENVGPGHVFKILSQPEQKIDPITRKKYRLPYEQVGLMMVFRTFEKVSYGIITNTNRPLRAGDLVVHPDSLN